MQMLWTAIIVAGCAGYVLWTLLLPVAARRRILSALGRKQPAAPATGCGSCDGCEPRAPAATSQVVRWLPRRRG